MRRILQIYQHVFQRRRDSPGRETSARLTPDPDEAEPALSLDPFTTCVGSYRSVSNLVITVSSNISGYASTAELTEDDLP